MSFKTVARLALGTCRRSFKEERLVERSATCYRNGRECGYEA